LFAKKHSGLHNTTALAAILPLPNRLYTILFCLYIDNLLQRLSGSGVICYVEANFVGTLAYADDIVFVCPTPAARRKRWLICDAFATEYAQKSKLLVA